MNTNEPVHFTGLPNWAKITIVFTALLLGALSIGFAWKDASDANKTIAFGQKDVEVISTVARLGQTGIGNDQALAVHTLNSIIHLKAITNHQSLAGLAIGSGSAFLAIGFALFLLGADGAFRIQFAGKGDSKLTFYATAPGLLCILLAAILIVVGATRKHEILLGDFNLIGDQEISKQETTGNANQARISQDEIKASPQTKLAEIKEAPRTKLAEIKEAPQTKLAEIKGAPHSSPTTAGDPARETLPTTRVCIDRYHKLDYLPVKKFASVRLGGGSSRAMMVFRKLWINGSKLRVRFLDGDPALQAKVKKYAEQWTHNANIQFEFGSHSDSEIRVSFEGRSLWSYIGTDALQVPKDNPTMNLGGITNETTDNEIRSLVLHEFGHALGLEHEFNPPSDKIQWNSQFLHQFFAQPPNKWSPEETDGNFIERYSVAHIRGRSFDSKSIMLMAVPTEFTLDGFQIQWNQDLSALDKAFIASEQAYPHTAVQAIELGVNAAPVSTSIGLPGEEDLFKFNVKKSGRHIIQTGGQTDVVMKLFGPNNQMSFITEDDDGGIGLNARITAQLIPGQYFSQVRHYNKAQGTGSYSISVNQN